MIHFGKPYLEACGAIVAGIALGSLSMRTKSIYQGFLVHITIAGVMDWLALRHRKATPIHFWPSDFPFAVPFEDQQREALARVIERRAGAVFALIFVFLVVMIVRQHRAQLEKVFPFLPKKP
jgi:hypothetical protein